MDKSGSEPAKEDRLTWSPRTWWKWLIVVPVVAALTIWGIWALYWAIEPDSVNARNEFARTVVQILGGGALLTSLYFTYQSLQVNRRSLQLNFDTQQDSQKANRDRDVTARFTSAVEQLGSEKREVRLGAIYALERLSKDSAMDYLTIMELLMAYVRERSPWEKPNESKAEREVRLNSPIGIDNQAVLTVIQRRGKWFGHGEHTGLDLRATQLMRVDLTGAHLERAKLFGVHLDGATLGGTHLEGADLTEADLTGADLRSAKLTEANLWSAEFRKADLTEADLTGADLRSANLTGAILVKADLTEADLTGADLRSANLTGAILVRARFQGAHLEGARLQEAILVEADLEGAILVGTYLTGTNLRSANLTGATLMGATLMGAHLEGANLRRAILVEAYLEGANLTGADLRSAILEEANLTGAILMEAHLEGADLTGVLGLEREQLRRAYLSRVTKFPPGIEIDLSEPE